MNFRKAILSSTIAIAWLAGASVLDAARANDADNPYLPKPAASTETADHGQGSYCSFGAGIPGYSCEAPKLTGGGPGNTDNNAATLTKDVPYDPPSPPCDKGGDKGPKV